VKIVYLTELERTSDGQVYFWHPYPANSKTNLSLRATVITSSAEAGPKFFTEDLKFVTLATLRLFLTSNDSGVEFEPSDDGHGAGTIAWRVNIEESAWKPTSPFIVIGLPKGTPKSEVLVEKSKLDEEHQYFAITDRIPKLLAEKVGTTIPNSESFWQWLTIFPLQLTRYKRLLYFGTLVYLASEWIRYDLFRSAEPVGAKVLFTVKRSGPLGQDCREQTDR